jgi:hypothetical protein
MNANNTATVSYKFATSDAAWTFMRRVESLGISAGFPSVDGRHTVEVLVADHTRNAAELTSKALGGVRVASPGAELYMCDDCTIVAVNGDDTGLDDATAARVAAGLETLPANTVPNFDGETGEGVLEFTARPCSCCGTPLAGSRHRFAVLVPASVRPLAKAKPAARKAKAV